MASIGTERFVRDMLLDKLSDELSYPDKQSIKAGPDIDFVREKVHHLSRRKRRWLISLIAYPVLVAVATTGLSMVGDWWQVLWHAVFGLFLFVQILNAYHQLLETLSVWTFAEYVLARGQAQARVAEPAVALEGY